MGRDLLGRSDPLRLLDDAWRAAEAGKPRVVLITGEAGVGKSTLVHHWLDTRLGDPLEAPAVRLRADPDDASLDLTTATQLLGHLAARNGRTSSGRDHSKPQAPSDMLEAGAALLAAFGESQSQGRTAITFVDDLHWADPASLTAIAFAARRLREDHFLLIGAARDTDLPAAAASLTRLAREPSGLLIHLDGLALEATAGLVHAVTGHQPDAVTLQALHEATRGNPLWIRSVVDHLSAPQLRSGHPLPVASTLAATLREQVDRCTPPAQRFLFALATLTGQQPVQRVSELAGLSQPDELWPALDGALASGLIRCTGDPPELHVSFTHPAMASAIEESLTFAERHTLHHRAAESAATVEERLRHQVACSAGPDSRLADEVLELGRLHAAEGRLLEAAHWIGKAAALTAEPSHRDELLLETAHTALVGGYQGVAISALESPPAMPSGYRDFLTGWLAWLRGDATEARSRSAHAAASPDERARLGAAHLMAQCELISENGAAAVAWAQQAAQSARPVDADLARATWAAGLFLQRDTEAGLAVLGPLPHELTAADIPREGVRGLLLIQLDRHDEARQVLHRAWAAVRWHNHYNLASVPLANLGMVENRTGNWAAATLALTQAVAYAETFGEIWGLSVIHALAALVPSRRGEFTTADAELRAATDALTSAGLSGHTYTTVAGFHLAHARHDSTTMLRLGGVLARRPPSTGCWIPGLFQWAGRYAEVLARAGRVNEARALAQQLARDSAPGVPRSAAAESAFAAAAVCEAIGRLQEAHANWAASARLYADSGMPFDAALAGLRLGQHLARRGQREQASLQLTAAAAQMSSLDAGPYTEEAQAALAGTTAGRAQRSKSTRQRTDQTRAGATMAQERAPQERTRQRSRPKPPEETNEARTWLESASLNDGATRLTAQEAVVARLVSTGMSNRQVAAEMLLSVRTIEFHLASIFRKLGVQSRTQLAARLLQPTSSRPYRP